ncbi:unnamed protein product, partial [Boreogadus saida]
MRQVMRRRRCCIKEQINYNCNRRRWSSSSEGGSIWLETGMEDAVPDSKILILINEQIKNLNMIYI